MREMKLSEYADLKGVHYRTALWWFHAGSIPGRRMPSGTILVRDDAEVVRAQSVRRAALRARLYGLRRSKRATEKLIKELGESK